MASLDIVDMLRHDAKQLMRMSEQSRLAGEGVAVRVLAPEILHAVMMDAADEIETLRQARAEGFRLCQEMAAATIIDAADANGQVYAMRAAAKVRALKVDGETP